MKIKIKTGDTVKVMSGKDKGKEAKVEKVLVKKGKVLVQGVNVYKKHFKGSQNGQQSGIYDLARPLDISKVGIICGSCKKAVKTGVKEIKGSFVRVCRKCGKEI